MAWICKANRSKFAFTQFLKHMYSVQYMQFCTWNSQAYILCCIWQLLYMELSGVHFVLHMAAFVYGTLGRTFCAAYGSFCTWNSRAYILCCIWQFLYMELSGIHFVLHMAAFVYGTLGRTFCAAYGSFCTWNFQAVLH